MNIASTANATQAALQALSQAQASAGQAAQRLATGRTANPADIVSLMTAQHQVEAGAAVLKMLDEANGVLLDITA